MSDPLAAPRILWLALCASQLVLAAVALFLPTGPHGPPNDVMPIAIGVVSAVIAVMSFVLPATFLANAWKRRESLVTTEADPEAMPLYRDKAPAVRVLRVDAAALRSLVVVWQVPFILSMAFSEAITLNGVVLSRIGFEARTFAPFLVAGTVLALVRVPTRARILASAGRALAARVVDVP